MSEMNGAHPIIDGPLRPVDPVIQMLEEMLQTARSGQLNSLAIVAVTHQAGVAAVFCGPQSGLLYTGAGMLQRRLMRVMDPPPEQRSPILRPGR